MKRLRYPERRIPVPQPDSNRDLERFAAMVLACAFVMLLLVCVAAARAC